MKRVTTKSIIVLTSLLIPIFSGWSFASDFNPPPWRGSPGSTYQRWSFSTSDTSPTADEYNNPYGVPTVTDSIDGDWYNQIINPFNSHQGVWYTQTINFLVPNDTTTLNNTKYRVQIIWSPSATAPVGLGIYVHDVLGTVEANIIDEYIEPGWRYTTFEVTTAPFDSTPVIYYQAQAIQNSQIVPVFVDEVIIDTIIIPEPATLCLTGIGFLLLKKRRAS